MKILLDIGETCDVVSLSASTIKRKIKEGSFPKPVHIGTRVLFRRKDLDLWSEQLMPAIESKDQELWVTPKKKVGRKRMAV